MFKKKLVARRKAAHMAVAAALPILMAGGNVYAACTTGSAPTSDLDTVSCTEGSTYSNPAGTTVSNTATIANIGNTANLINSVVNMVGNGNKFTNAGTLSNTSTYTNTTTNAGQKFGLYMGSGTGTDEEKTNAMTNAATGNISATVSAANVTSVGSRVNTQAVVGIGTDVEGLYTLTNRGAISATHHGVGRVNGVEAGGDVVSFTFDNYGTVTGTRGSAITVDVRSASAFTGHTANFTTAATLGPAAGLYAEEEVKELYITNHEGGIIQGTGNFVNGIFSRAAYFELTNEGTIGISTGSTGYAIGSSDASGAFEVDDANHTFRMDVGVTKFANESSGVVNGDVIMVDTNGSAGTNRYWNAVNPGTGSELYDPTAVGTHYRRDSTIENEGTINGSVYLGAGNHTLTNEGTITGKIDVRQNTTLTYTATNTAGNNPSSYTAFFGMAGSEDTYASSAALIAANPEHVLHLENAGTIGGDVTIRGTQANSKVEFVPVITGSGTGSSVDAPSTNAGQITGKLKIVSDSTFNLAAGAGTSSANTVLSIAPKIQGAAVKDGNWYKVAGSLYGAGNGADLSALIDADANTTLVTWTAMTNATGELVVGADVASVSTLGLSGNANAVIGSLLGSNSVAGGTIQNLTTAAEFEEAAKQLQPEVNNASMNAALGITSQVQGVIDGHVGEVHLAQAGMSGIATGEGTLNQGFWVQGFGFYGNQDQLHSVAGYTANAGGFAAGYDTLVDVDTRVGLAVSYGRTGVDSKGTAGSGVDLDSYQAIAYGSYLGKGWYVNANAGIGLHKYDSKRVVALLGQTLSGDYDAWQFSGKVDGGYPIKAGKDVTIIPMVSAAYSHLAQDGYTETGGSAALTVADNDTDSFRTGAGAKALLTLSDASEMSTVLEGRAMWLHEFGDTSQDTTANFAGGGTFTTNGVSIDRNSYNVGASLQFTGKSAQQTITLSYDAEIRDEYLGHTAKLQARFDF